MISQVAGALTRPLPLPDTPVVRWLREQRFPFYVLIAVAVIMISRAPELIWEPRFWAEEGNVYYKRALVSSWWDTLTYTYPKAGYFALSASLPTALAGKLFPLAWGPTVTTLFSLMVQLLPFVVILWGRSYVWSSWPQKLLACAVLVFSVNATHVWLNTVNLQSWFGLISACILVERWRDLSKIGFGVQALLHLVGCLSGPYSLFLAPVFGLKALMVRHARAWFLVGLTALAGIYQVSEVGKVQKRMNKGRRSISEITLQEPFAVSFSQHVVAPIAGVEPSFEVLRKFLPRKEGREPWKKGVPLALLLTTALVFVRREPHGLWLLFAFLLGSVLTTVFSFNFWAGSRYAAFPSFVFGCMLVASVDFQAMRAFFKPDGTRPRPPVRSFLCLLLCLSTIVAGMVYFKHDKRLIYVAESPVWTYELAKWRENPEYCPKIWPVTRIPGQWKVNMRGVDPKRP